MSAFLRKYNGHLAVALILAMIVSVSMQLVHDQLADHDHGIECPMFVVDGSTPMSVAPASCGHVKQTVEAATYSPISLIYQFLDRQQARAPPAYL